MQFLFIYKRIRNQIQIRIFNIFVLALVIDDMMVTGITWELLYSNIISMPVASYMYPLGRLL